MKLSESVSLGGRLSPRQQGELLRVVNQLTSEGRLNAADISSVAAMHRAPHAVSSYDPVRSYVTTRFGSQSLALGAANQATADTWRIPTAGVSHSSVMVVATTMIVAPEVTTTVAGLMLLGAALLIGMGHQIKDITEDAISVFPMSHSDDDKAQPAVVPRADFNNPDPNDPCKGVNSPELPPSTIVSENGVTITHYYFGRDHGPGHMHVVEGGRNITRIGPNGHPIAGDAALTSKSRRVIEKNISKIRSAGDKIGRWLEWKEKCGQ
jgi:hypothetical protein